MDSYQNAIKLLDEFILNPNLEILRKSSEFLLESMSLNKKHAPTYYCLAYVFYALDNTNFAMQFIKIAEKLCPEPPVELIKFKNIVLNEGAIYKSYEMDDKKKLSFDMSRKTASSSKQVYVEKPAPLIACVSDKTNFMRLQRERPVDSYQRHKSSGNAASSELIRPSTKERVSINKLSSMNLKKPEELKAKLAKQSSFWSLK